MLDHEEVNAALQAQGDARTRQFLRAYHLAFEANARQRPGAEQNLLDLGTAA